MISPARTAAFDILRRVEREGAYADELLHSERLAALSAADRGLATEITMGVLRWRSRLDDALQQFASQPLARLDIEVLIALRLAAYQILFLERVPKHAAVNDSVELVKRSKKKSAAGFVNAVLRKLTPADRAASLPISPSAEAIAIHYAHPLWLVERWREHYGIESAARICEHNQQRPEASVRLLDPAAGQELEAAGIQLAPGRLLTGARRVLTGDIRESPAFREKRLQIQDEASQLVALLVGRGERILDCCAAPGGKTRILAAANPASQILATELHEQRARTLRQRVPERNVEIQTADVTKLQIAQSFDRILVDVPCSGTGTLARNPEIKWRLTPRDLGDLQRRQVAILNAALDRLAPAGRLVYSTCSLEPEEGEDVIAAVSANRPGFMIGSLPSELGRIQDEGALALNDFSSLLKGDFIRTIPGVHQCDGFFAAMIERAR